MAHMTLPPLTWRFFLSWLIGRVQRYRVVGESMLPTLSPSTDVLVDCRAPVIAAVQAGDVVCFPHPDQPGLLLIKRVSLRDDDALSVLGDYAHQSQDSRHFGRVRLQDIIGRVVCTFP